MLNSIAGPAREEIDAEEMERLRSSVIIDERRRRPLYFDGRFLAAQDLRRDQNHVLVRMADLGRAGGTGVAQGLMVRRAAGTGREGVLRIGAGHGITPAGELVVLPEDLDVDVQDITRIQRLDAAFGLAEAPREPGRNLTGLFIVALRPVEFNANPVASYPTGITGQRSVEFGDVVEAVAITLVPYPDDGTGSTPEARRARVAGEVFVGRGRKSPAASALPIAMVHLNRGRVDWVDPYMVRREMGADDGDVLGLGIAPRALRQAHLLQYDHHLREVLELRRATGLGERFAASDYFQALPPAGRLPAAAVNRDDFTQAFFPPAVNVDLSLVPEDEIPALLEESLLLPPVDLTRPADELDAVTVLILVPVSRADFRAHAAALQTVERQLGSAAPWALASRRPLEVLQGLRLPPGIAPATVAQAALGAADGTWRGLIPTTGMLWYLRRRNLQHRGDVVGQPVPVQNGTPGVEWTRGEAELEVPLEQEVLLPAPGMEQIAPPPAGTAIGADHERVTLASPGVETRAARAARVAGEAPPEPPGAGAESLAAAVVRAAREAEAEGAELPVGSETFAANPRFGTGLARLDRVAPELRGLPQLARGLVESGVADDLDRLARRLRVADLRVLAEELRRAGRGRRGSAAARAARVLERRRGRGGER